MQLIRFQILCLFLFYCYTAVGQDFEFSQQYANRLHLNPAFTGLISDYSVTAAYRNQWMDLDNGFVTQQIAGDYKFKNKKTAAGLVISLDKAGKAGFTRIQAGGIYAYQTPINKQFNASVALQASYGSQRFTFNNLIFGDQINNDGSINPNSQENYVYDPVSYLSVSAGGILYNNQFWVGLAAHHVNQPGIGFESTSKLPVRFTLNTGYKLYVNNYYRDAKLYEFSITPTFTYMQQQNFKNTALGVYLTYTPVTLGLLYKGSPFSNNKSDNQVRAVNAGKTDQVVAVIVGTNLEPFRISYSYDVVFAGIGSRYGGAHEIAISFDKADYDKIFKSRASGKNYKHIACPSF